MSFRKTLQTGQGWLLQSAKLCHNLLMEKQRQGLFIILHYSFHRKQRYCTNIEKAQRGYGDANCCISDPSSNYIFSQLQILYLIVRHKETKSNIVQLGAVRQQLTPTLAKDIHTLSED